MEGIEDPEQLTDELLAEVFPNPPLSEVAFQASFTPLLKVERNLPEFQEKIASEYPLFEEAIKSLDGAKAINTSEFKAANRLKTIRVTMQSFGFMSQKYEDFEDYKDELLRHLTNFCDTVEIRAFVKVGLRYINHIRMELEDGIYPIQRQVVSLIDTQKVRLEEIKDLRIVVRTESDDNKMLIRSGIVVLPQVASEIPSAVYVLDYDSYVTDEVELSEMSSLLDTLHDRIQRRFLSEITDEYLETMRSEGGHS